MLITDPSHIQAFQTQGQALRLDANTIFTPRDLEFIESAVMATEYEQLDGALLVPFDTSVPAWYKEVTARTSNAGGKPVVVGAATTQIPNVDVDIEEDSWNIRQFAIGASWSKLELQASQALGRALDTSQAVAAVTALNTQINDVIFDGLLGNGLRGWFDTNTVPRVEFAAGINDSYTATAILTAINEFINAVADDTNSVEKPNRLALSSRAYDYAKNTMMSTDNGTSILDQLVANNTFITSLSQVVRIPKMRLISAGGIPTAKQETLAVYNFDPNKVRLNVVNPMAEGQIMQLGLQYLQLYTASMSEVQWRRPKSARIGYNTNRTS